MQKKNAQNLVLNVEKYRQNSASYPIPKNIQITNYHTFFLFLSPYFA